MACQAHASVSANQVLQTLVRWKVLHEEHSLKTLLSSYPRKQDDE